MMRALTLSMLVVVAGCTSRELTIDTSHIKVYDGRPFCDYESLGPVSGRDGRTPSQDANNFIRNANATAGNQDLALQRMKLEAMDMGADGVIVMLRDVVQGPSGGGARGAARRPSQEVVYKGIAIVGCERQSLQR